MGRKALICGIYKITCKANGKTYIGKSKNIFRRINVHYMNLLKGTHPNHEILDDFNKYGLDNFSFEVLEIVEDVSGPCNIEQRLIREHKSHLPEYGYNMDIRTIKEGRKMA